MISQTTVALRGIIAGTGFPISEMRVIHIKGYGQSNCGAYDRCSDCFVDDIAADMCGLDTAIVKNLRGFIAIIAQVWPENGLGLFATSRSAQRRLWSRLGRSSDQAQ